MLILSPANRRAFARRAVEEALTLEPHSIEPDRPFEEYGMDSILAVRALRDLRARYPALPDSLFLECSTLRQIEERVRTETASG